MADYASLIRPTGWLSLFSRDKLAAAPHKVGHVGLLAWSVALVECTPDHADDIAAFDVRFAPNSGADLDIVQKQLRAWRPN